MLFVAVRQKSRKGWPGVCLATYWLGARRIRGLTLYSIFRQPPAAIWRGLGGSDESLLADETVGAALRAG